MLPWPQRFEWSPCPCFFARFPCSQVLKVPWEFDSEVCHLCVSFPVRGGARLWVGFGRYRWYIKGIQNVWVYTIHIKDTFCTFYRATLKQVSFFLGARITLNPSSQEAFGNLGIKSPFRGLGGEVMVSFAQKIAPDSNRGAWWSNCWCGLLW
jgi:hypothetical protein